MAKKRAFTTSADMETLLAALSQRARTAVDAAAGLTTAADLLRLAMEEAERLPLQGSQKAALVQQVLASRALHAVLPDRVLTPLLALLENDLLKPLMDAIVAAANGDVRINAAVQAVGCCVAVGRAIAAARRPPPAAPAAEPAPPAENATSV
jgi:hypothetical protein